MEDWFGNEMPEGFVIFLDVDGPLVSYGNLKARALDGENEFKPEAIYALNKIIEYYDATLCMVSSWNSKFGGDAKRYAGFMRSRGLQFKHLVIGDHSRRSEYVIDLIDRGLNHYLIIDDEAHQYYSKMGFIDYKRILQPNRQRCLDCYDVWQVTINYKLNT